MNTKIYSRGNVCDPRYPNIGISDVWDVNGPHRINQQAFDVNRYSNSISNKAIQQDPPIEYETDYVYQHITSRSRDITNYPDTGSFIVSLVPEVKSVVSIELLSTIVPNVNNITNLPYLLLSIKEINHFQVGPGDFTVFSVLQIVNPYGTGQAWMNLEKRLAERSIAIFRPEKTRLTKLTIQLLQPDGTPFSFGTDTNTINEAHQWSFTLKFTCRIPNANSLYRNSMGNPTAYAPGLPISYGLEKIDEEQE